MRLAGKAGLCACCKLAADSEAQFIVALQNEKTDLVGFFILIMVGRPLTLDYHLVEVRVGHAILHSHDEIRVGKRLVRHRRATVGQRLACVPRAQLVDVAKLDGALRTRCS